MLIELARYTMLFALTAVGLQTVLLAPTLWSGGSAVAIKLGFRQACFSAALTFFSFCVLRGAVRVTGVLFIARGILFHLYRHSVRRFSNRVFGQGSGDVSGTRPLFVRRGRHFVFVDGIDAGDGRPVRAHR